MNNGFNPLTNVDELHIEVSDSCNLNCNYCYFVEKNKITTPFPLENLDNILKEFFAKTTCDVTLVFHGGEPLMASADWIDNACEIAKKYAFVNEHEVCFHLQTNGTLLTDKHIEVLKKHKFTVNVSLDGPREVHDAARGSFNKTIHAIEALQKAGVFNSVITVIGKHNYNRIHDIVELFISHGISKYHFNIGSILNDKKNLILSESEIFSFLKDSYVEFTNSYRDSCNWVLLGKLQRFVSKEIPPLACDSPICGAGIHKIHMKQNGDFYPCGSCVNTNTGMKEFLLGNIMDTFSKKKYELFLTNFHHLYFEHLNNCTYCESLTLCDFFCPAFDGYDSTTISNKCKAYKAFSNFLNGQNLNIIKTILDFYEK